MAKYDDESSQIRYIVIGKEVGENGTPHLQGFVQMKVRKRTNPMKEIIGQRAHLEKRRGKPEQAADYCKKDGNWQQKRRDCNRGTEKRFNYNGKADVGWDVSHGTPRKQ